MASGRYNSRVKRFNRSEIYEELRAERGVNQIQQYLTQRIYKITEEDRASMATIRHIWETGDRYWKLAARYYKNPDYWWIIAWYNQKPTENHVKRGDVLLIPTPPERLAAKYVRPKNI